MLCFDGTPETWKVVVRSKMRKYPKEDQSAIGQDNSNMHVNASGESKKEVKQDYWKAKRLTAEVNLMSAKGHCSEEEIGDATGAATSPKEAL